MASDELRVPIGIPVDTNASVASDAIKDLRDSVTRSRDAIKESADAMRNLRGKSDEVKAAKDQLKAKIREEEAAVTAATLKLLKQGAAYDDTAKKAKLMEAQQKAADADKKKRADADKKHAEETKSSQDAMSKAIGGAGGPVASLKGKLESLNETLGGSSGGMALVAGAAALTVAALAAVAAGAIATAAAVTKFIIVSSDALRMRELTAKANLNGNSEWAKHLGEQVDAIRRTVPMAKEQLEELGISFAKSRIGGQTMVDSMKAVAGATTAAGADLGAKLKSMVERGAITKRFQLSPQELLGMDLDFTEVAKAYAAGMHISVEAARRALVSGRVKLADGAAALKTAVESKFGSINADKLLGLDNQLSKFKEDLAGLTKDVDLTPILKAIKGIADNFDGASVNGKAMRNIVTTIGRAIGVTFKDGAPVVQDFVDKAVWGALKIENYWLRAKIAFAGIFGKNVSLEWTLFKSALAGVTGAAEGVAAAIIPGGQALSGLADSAKLALAATKGIETGILSLKDSLKDIKWGDLGGSIVDGLVDGITSRAKHLVDSVKGLANSVKNTFRGEMKIQSPSRVMYEDGRFTAKGAEKGIRDGVPGVRAAAKELAPVPDGGGSLGIGGGSRRGGSVSLTFAPVINVQGSGGDVQAQLRDPSLLQPLTELFLQQVRAAGFEVST